jgi:hypothetical protein
MTFRRKKWGAVCLGLAIQSHGWVWGAPAISGVSGSTEPGQLFTINGTGFGSRGDFHSGSDKLARMFDDFNDGTLTGNPYETWRVFNASADPAVHSTDGSRTSRSGDGFYRRRSVGLGSLIITAGNRTEYYSSFYMRLSSGFDISSAGSGTHQFKIVRLYSTSNTDVNLYPAIGASDGFHIMTEFIEPPVMRYQLQLNAIPNKPAGWHKMAVYYKKSTSKDANNGHMRIWWDNKLVFDWLPHFQDPKNNPSSAPGYPITGDFDTDGQDLAGDWSVGNYFSSASGSTWVDFDDVYLDHSQARVELGNASTYNACTVLEIQPPAAWSGSQITARINRGALGTATNAYVYVIDPAGNVNASGYPLQGGAPPPVSATPPAAPRGFQPL